MMISRGNIVDLEASRDDTVIAPLKMANEKRENLTLVARPVSIVFVSSLAFHGGPVMIWWRNR
jgi:hypothetical protein